MDLRLAIEGNLAEVYRREALAGEHAAMVALRAVADEGKAAARAQVMSAGLGPRVANAWRNAVYPSRGQSLNGAMFIYSRASRIVRAFDEGAVITAKRGRALAIPTDAVPKNITVATGDGAARRQRATPAAVERALGVKLREVPGRGNRTALLVLDDARVTSRGLGRRASATAIRRGRTATVVMFFLVYQTRLPKRLSIAAVETLVANRFPDRFVEEWNRLADAA
jgi:hypothetical protein